MSAVVISYIPVRSLIDRQNEARRRRTRRRQRQPVQALTDTFRRAGVFIGMDGSIEK